MELLLGIERLQNRQEVVEIDLDLSRLLQAQLLPEARARRNDACQLNRFRVWLVHILQERSALAVIQRLALI